MNPKPVLFWPRSVSEIEPRLGLAPAAFRVVDTNSAYELQKLSKITPATPILDPYPRRGRHYREFENHIAASGCRFHLVGLRPCQGLSQALNDPSLAHASVEELLAAIKPGMVESRFRLPIDWSRLNFANTVVVAVLVFAASWIGNMLFPGNSLIAAVAAVLVFAALCACVRIAVQAVERP
jgi:hypothetical protein